MLVTGEASVGKTRLVDELRARAGAVTVEARAYPAEGPLAYGLAAAWLRSQPVSARLSRLERPQLTELARLLPELAGHVPPPEPLPEAELRHRLLGAIARAVLASGTPLLLIADDVQWADAQSLGLVHYLMRVFPSVRLLVAATVRREELDEDHPLTGLTTAVAAPGPAGLDRLYRDSEGSPLFVVEALRPDAPDAQQVQAVIAGRLARLSPQAAAMAGVAAAIGQAFTADVLAAATGLDEQAFVAALDELWRRGIVRAHGPNAYDFSHGRIRDAAYAALGPPRRRHVHLAVARALERGEHPAAATIAPHYEQAGATAEAVRWHGRAAEAAQWLHAHADAVRALERALALSAGLPPGPDTVRLQLRLLTGLPAPLLACEGYASERIGRVHARALQLAGQLGGEPEPPLVWSLAMAALCRGEWEPARGFAGRLRARAEHDDDQVLWVESGYLQGIAAYWAGRLAQARGCFEAAMERFRAARRRAHVLRYGQDPELVVRSGWGPRCSPATWTSLTAERTPDSRGSGRYGRNSSAARRPRRGYPASPPACCSRVTRWPAGRRPGSRWPARRSAWAAARSCGRPRSGGCARRSWRPAALPRARSRPNSSARSRWPGASRRACSSSGSGKRSRNAPSATVVLSDDRPEEQR